MDEMKRVMNCRKTLGRTYNKTPVTCSRCPKSKECESIDETERKQEDGKTDNSND